jgi:hypothetical protein
VRAPLAELRPVLDITIAWLSDLDAIGAQLGQIGAMVLWWMALVRLRSGLRRSETPSTFEQKLRPLLCAADIALGDPQSAIVVQLLLETSASHERLHACLRGLLFNRQPANPAAAAGATIAETLAAMGGGTAQALAATTEEKAATDSVDLD